MTLKDPKGTLRDPTTVIEGPRSDIEGPTVAPRDQQGHWETHSDFGGPNMTKRPRSDAKGPNSGTKVLTGT